MYESDDLGEADLSPARSVQPLLDRISMHPRLAKLLKVAREGTPAERRALREAVVRECQAYVKDLPDIGREGSPWRPSVLHPGGGIAYGLILRECDPDATTLPVLVQVWQRQQAAYGRLRSPPSNEWTTSNQASIVADACEHFLDVYASREDLRKKLTPKQAEVLAAYQEARGEKGQSHDELRTMRFAVDFVGAAGSP
jgi:hypothetical protein